MDLQNTQDLADEIKQATVDAVRGREVTEHLKQTVEEAVKHSADDFSRVSFIERQRTVRDAMFHNTENLLYGLHALQAHLASEEEYIGMAFKEHSGSVVHYQKNSPGRLDDDQLLEDRRKSYERSKNDYERVMNALKKVQGEKGYQILELRYLSEDAKPTWEQIAEQLAGTEGFSERLTEKTVRRYKNRLINKISVLLFGTDAL